MGYLTKYGSVWGDVPSTSGNVHWVSPGDTYIIEGRTYSASDNNDGLSPERALRTIQQAITNAYPNGTTASLTGATHNDVVMLLPGSHTSAATVTLNKAGLTFVGCAPSTRISPNMRANPAAFKTTWTSTFAGVGITLTAADTTFIGINFVPVTARSMMTMVTCPRTAFLDCLLTMSATASTSTKGFVMSGGSSANCSWTNCVFYNTIGAQGPAVDVTGGVDFLVDKCVFNVTVGSWAIAAQMGAASTGMWRDNELICSGTAMTKGISGTGVAAAKAIIAVRNYCGVSPGAAGITDMGTTSYCELDNNYVASIGGGAGGALMTTIS